MLPNIGGGRALRVCDLCGGVDDHPRHVIAGGDTGRFPKPSGEVIAAVANNAPPAQRNRLIEQLLDTGSSDRHMDCCRAAGCPTGDCDRVPDVRGSDLLNALTTEEH